MRILFPLLLSFLILPSMAVGALDCVVVPADEIQLPSTHGGGEVEFTSRSGVRVRLAVDASTLDIRNPAFTGELHPVEPEVVRRALRDMRAWDGEPLRATVYCLPGYPTQVGRSFAVGTEVFLAPGFAAVEDEVVAYTVVHELGHVLQNTRMPGRHGARWEEYVRMRDIGAADTFHDHAPHRDRPGEIFAEDFRALYGGPLATYSGTIENQDLPAPATVDGLEAWFRDLLEEPQLSLAPRIEVGNHPNPFNPETTITVALDAASVLANQPVRLRVFDLRGRQVRDLGVRPAAAWLEVRWDGHDDTGRAVASGRYLCQVSTGPHATVRPMLLVK